MVASWLLKSCPKCKGDLHQEHDGFDEVLVCFQCAREYRNQAPVTDQPPAWHKGTTRGMHKPKKRCQNHPEADVYSNGLCENCHRREQRHRKRATV